jgi:hypothetical protein
MLMAALLMMGKKRSKASSLGVAITLKKLEKTKLPVP